MPFGSPVCLLSSTHHSFKLLTTLAQSIRPSRTSSQGGRKTVRTSPLRRRALISLLRFPFSSRGCSAGGGTPSRQAPLSDVSMVVAIRYCILRCTPMFSVLAKQIKLCGRRYNLPTTAYTNGVFRYPRTTRSTITINVPIAAQPKIDRGVRINL